MVDNKPCLGYTKAQIVPLAIAKGVTVSDNDTVKSICEKLQKPSTPPKMKKAVIAKEKTDAKVVGVMEKRRLTNSAIKSNLNTLYGKNWMNTYRGVMPSLNENVAAIKKRIDVLELKKNKKGLPFKRDVDALKKSTVREWKLMRKKMLNNKLNNLNNNFANELENLLNVESVKKKSPKKKFLKGTKVEEL
jgi:ribosomal protein S20